MQPFSAKVILVSVGRLRFNLMMEQAREGPEKVLALTVCHRGLGMVPRLSSKT